jgi:predicted transposase/invertase (TIGR01784 family)
MRFFFIQTPYFKKRESELATPLDKWLFFLRNLNALSDIPPPLRAEKPFQTAFATAEFARMTPAEQVAYLTDIDAENSFASALEAKWDDGVEQGRAEGATAAKLETARKMKAKGFAAADIAELTGLSPSEVEGL